MRTRLVRFGALAFAMAVVASVVPAGTGFAQQAPSDARVPTVSGPVTGGKGIQALGIGYDFPSIGYELEEYFYEGDAVGHQRVGTFATNGKWRVEESTTAPFKTRMVVIRPADPADFNGTVYVEWFNVTGGVDAGATFLMGHNQVLRTGAAWVGVTSQLVGVTGSANTATGGSVVDVPQGGLRGSDPARYGSLVHPGDLYSYDIFSHAARAIRGEGAGVSPLGDLKAKRLIAMGESQSAGRLTTYVNAVHPLAGVFDGFLIHSRGSTPAPLGERAANAPDPDIPANARIRTDLDEPVFTFETEYDVHVGGYAGARQPDTDRFRLWEVAGTSHIDSYTGGAYSLTDLGDGKAEAAILDPAKASGGIISCVLPMNAGAQHAPLTASMAHLERWVRKGTPPPRFPRIETAGEGATLQIVRDELGLARGGVRTPIVDVPLAVNVGDGTNTPAFCRVFGHTTPLDAAALAELYPGGTKEYRAKFDKAVDRALRSGIWLEPEADNFKAAAANISIG